MNELSHRNTLPCKSNPFHFKMSPSFKSLLSAASPVLGNGTERRREITKERQREKDKERGRERGIKREGENNRKRGRERSRREREKGREREVGRGP